MSWCPRIIFATSVVHSRPHYHLPLQGYRTWWATQGVMDYAWVGDVVDDVSAYDTDYLSPQHPDIALPCHSAVNPTTHQLSCRVSQTLGQLGGRLVVPRLVGLLQGGCMLAGRPWCAGEHAPDTAWPSGWTGQVLKEKKGWEIKNILTT